MCRGGCQGWRGDCSSSLALDSGTASPPGDDDDEDGDGDDDDEDDSDEDVKDEEGAVPQV